MLSCSGWRLATSDQGSVMDVPARLEVTLLRATCFVLTLQTGHEPRRHCDPGLDSGEAIQTHRRSNSGLLRRYAPLHEPISQVVGLLGSPVGAPLRRDRCFGRAACRSRREVAPTGGFVVHGPRAVSGRNRWLAMTHEQTLILVRGERRKAIQRASSQIQTIGKVDPCAPIASCQLPVASC